MTRTEAINPGNCSMHYSTSYFPIVVPRGYDSIDGGGTIPGMESVKSSLEWRPRECREHISENKSGHWIDKIKIQA